MIIYKTHDGYTAIDGTGNYVISKRNNGIELPYSDIKKLSIQNWRMWMVPKGWRARIKMFIVLWRWMDEPLPHRDIKEEERLNAWRQTDFYKWAQRKVGR